MLKLITGFTGATVKTAVGLPVTLAADLMTMGGELTDKKGNQTYSGDMLDSINRSLKEMSED